MNATAAAGAAAITFVWLGMVLAISFLEAPLKFRAPGVTIPIGLGIGRLVFRGLNLTETTLAAAVITAVAIGNPSTAVTILTAVVSLLLATQLVVIRPRLNRRSDQILTGADLPRSRTHLYYVALETAKAIALISLGASLLAT